MVELDSGEREHAPGLDARGRCIFGRAGQPGRLVERGRREVVRLGGVRALLVLAVGELRVDRAEECLAGEAVSGCEFIERFDGAAVVVHVCFAW